ncbi:trimeric intracellular cation channel family protein [Nocardia huaxiensis]|uniref:Trimeric intracellular cation channel family protein n=1 Tax=Nocardia huaxiensis TaxID=2755382 RepID=A0A7D6VD30_9NOCA|nr:trimeric intracellular cation channel family protein [Nocardia huaxiensis]QLY32534.1 trimeric intracellular cation channel family protein [Nocardia huaxiensis]UFS93738.1 trimeric intracellular cation channel family protein [Nocardia huaxiensis]
MSDLVELGTAVDAAQGVGNTLGVFAFGVSGALLAVRRQFDVVGITVLAVATATGGGIIRDVIIGATPPTAFVNPMLAGVALLSALVIFFWHPPRKLVRTPLNVADAIGLGIFCVTGTVAAFQHGMSTWAAAALGVVTAVGGGIIRDVLAGVTPSVLSDGELYAVPALLGSAVTAALLHFGFYTYWTGGLAGAGAVGLRLIALWRHWHAPVARPHRRRDPV